MSTISGDSTSESVTPTRIPRDIRAIAMARLVSEMGDELALIALIFRLKDSGPRAISLLIALFAAARILLAPFSGAIADRFPTKRLILLVSCGQFVVTALLAISNDALVYPLVFLLAIGGTIVGPAWQSFVAHIVPGPQLSRVYAFIQAYRSVAIVLGAGVGGFAVETFGSRTALLVNAATFLFVGGVAATLRRERKPERRRIDGRELIRGFLTLIKHPVLRWSLILLAAFNMSAGVVEVLSVFLITNELGGAAADYGLVLGALGVSMVLTGMILSRVQPRIKDTTMLTISAVVSASGMLSYAFAPSMPVAVAAFLVNGAGLTGLHVFGTPIIVRHSKDEERGRIFAASSSVTTGGLLLASGIAGGVGEVLPPRPVIAIAALTCLCVAIFGGARIQRHDVVAAG